MAYNAKNHYTNHETADHYDQERFTSPAGRLTDKLEKRCIGKALAAAGLEPPARILDLPCGTGRMSLYLAAKQYRVTGIDISPAMVKLARQKAQQQPLTQPAFSVGDGEKLTLADAGYELVLCLRLFGHLPSANRLNLLKELTRVSSRWVLAAYYLRYSLRGLARRRMRRQQAIFWNPVTRQQLTAELQAAGLRLRRVFHLLPLVAETVFILAEVEQR